MKESSMSTHTPGVRSHLTLVNADPANVGTGAAVMSLIVAEATRRPHLAEAIESIQYDVNRGVGVLVNDAGARQHLANALGFEGRTFDFRLHGVGTGISRGGVMAGVQVTVWNIEP
jgi:hypothetical protein